MNILFSDPPGVRKTFGRSNLSCIGLPVLVAGALFLPSIRASGSIILDSTSGADPASASVTISNLDTTPTPASSGLTFASTGTVSGAASLSTSDSFSFTINAFSGWTATGAQAAVSTFNTYFSSLTTLDLGTINNGNFAPKDPGAASTDTAFSAGEALVFTFDTTSLTTPGSHLTLESFTTTLGGGDDRADFFVWDSDTQTFLTNNVNVNADSFFVGLDIGPLTTNDIVVVAANDPNNTSTWRIDELQFEVSVVPEPSTAVILAGLTTFGFFYRHRRKLRPGLGICHSTGNK